MKVMVHCLILACAVTWVVGCNESKDIDIVQLKENCTKAILDCKEEKVVSVSELQVLAWYRDRDERPWYVDSALCWAKVSTTNGPEWAIIQMGRNPMEQRRKSDREWHLYIVFDVGNTWLQFYKSPPTPEDVYKGFPFFRFVPEDGWQRYASHLDKKVWTGVFGTGPDKTI